MERHVRFYDLEINAFVTKGRDGKMVKLPVPSYNLETLVDFFISMYEEKATQNEFIIMHRKVDDFYLADIEKTDRKAVLLINRSDHSAPDPTISNPKSRERKVLEKPEGYGNDYSTHVVLSLDEDNGFYTAIFETARGSSIYGNHIHSFLNKLITDYKTKFKDKFLCDDPESEKENNGSPKQRNWNHKISLRGVIGDDFYEDINNGTMSGIELIDTKNRDSVWDEDMEVKEDKNIVYFSVKNSTNDSKGFLSRFSSKKSVKDFDNLRIRFIDSNNAAHSALIDIETLHLADETKYVKKTKIKVADRKDNIYGYERINGEIKNALIKLF